jgi:hypothetical protein
MELKNLNNLTFSEFFVKFAYEKESKLKSSLFPGAEIRGTLMMKSKQMFCVNKANFDNCKDCLLRYKCNYSLLFETPLPKQSNIMKKYDEIPHPFAMAVLPEKENITLRFVLFGEYIDSFPFIYLALSDSMKTKGLKIVDARNFDEQILKNGSIETNYLKKTVNDFSSNKEPLSNIRIDFISPLRIKYLNKLVNQTNFEFHHLIRNLLRRVSLLLYFYVGEKVDGDFKSITNQAEQIKIIGSDLKWLELDRFSMRTKQTLLLGGIIGNVLLGKDSSEFLPLLSLGHYTQVGKNISFGHGYFEIVKV